MKSTLQQIRQQEGRVLEAVAMQQELLPPTASKSKRRRKAPSKVPSLQSIQERQSEEMAIVERSGRGERGERSKSGGRGETDAKGSRKGRIVQQPKMGEDVQEQEQGTALLMDEEINDQQEEQQAKNRRQKQKNNCNFIDSCFSTRANKMSITPNVQQPQKIETIVVDKEGKLLASQHYDSIHDCWLSTTSARGKGRMIEDLAKVKYQFDLSQKQVQRLRAQLISSLKKIQEQKQRRAERQGITLPQQTLSDKIKTAAENHKHFLNILQELIIARNTHRQNLVTVRNYAVFSNLTMKHTKHMRPFRIYSEPKLSEEQKCILQIVKPFSELKQKLEAANQEAFQTTVERRFSPLESYAQGSQYPNRFFQRLERGGKARVTGYLDVKLFRYLKSPEIKTMLQNRIAAEKQKKALRDQFIVQLKKEKQLLLSQSTMTSVKAAQYFQVLERLELQTGIAKRMDKQIASVTQAYKLARKNQQAHLQLPNYTIEREFQPNQLANLAVRHELETKMMQQIETKQRKIDEFFQMHIEKDLGLIVNHYDHSYALATDGVPTADANRKEGPNQ